MLGKRFTTYIKSKDMFGHTISLNFNKQGNTHKTLIGGFFSFIIILAMSLYVFVNVKKLWLYEDDQVNTEIYKLDLDSLDELAYNDTKMFIFHTIRKQAGTKPVWFEEKEVQKYVKLGFVQRRDNWNLDEGAGRLS